MKIGNDNIFLNHFHRDYNSKKNKPVKNVPLILNGHYHSYHSINGSKRTIELDVPSLSTITPDLPTFLEFDFNIENNRFRYMNIKQILMENKVRQN